jgi:8-amino-7-oxononanoate synthase
MDDFTSAVYLGFNNASRQLPPWRYLTTGVPAALYESALNKWVAGKVAKMQGLERGILAPSSLHLFWDVFGRTRKETLILYDDKIYAVGKWGLERATLRGATVVSFHHQDADSLKHKIQTYAQPSSSLVVLTDGWCPHCGQPAPLPEYIQVIRKYKGLLMVDDTQALGILGANACQKSPYGQGGGGLLQWYNLQGDDMVTICSLAKAFGVPVAAMCGSRKWIENFKKHSETRVHTSPVSTAHVHAAFHVLTENKNKGSMLRHKLLKNVALFKQQLLDIGIATKGDVFPVQTLKLPAGTNVHNLYQQLLDENIRALLLEPHRGRKPVISLCISASHTSEQIRRATSCISKSISYQQNHAYLYV